jgi:hypothetical protein
VRHEPRPDGSAALQRIAVPAAERRRGLVRRLEEVEEDVVGTLRLPDDVVGQQELPELGAVERRGGPDGSGREPRGADSTSGAGDLKWTLQMSSAILAP